MEKSLLWTLMVVNDGKGEIMSLRKENSPLKSQAEQKVFLFHLLVIIS